MGLCAAIDAMPKAVSGDELETGSSKTSLREIFTRLGAVETGRAKLDVEVQGLIGAVGEIKNMITALRGELNRGTDWGILGTWAGVILAICGGCGWLALQPLRDRLDTADADRAALAETREMVARLDERSRWQAFVTVGEMP